MSYAFGSLANESLQRRMDRAARGVLDEYNPLSVAEDQEYAGLIYQTEGGSVKSTPGIPGGLCEGGPCGSNPWDALPHVPEGATILADWHTHGAFNPAQPDISYEYFSSGDVRGINSDANRYPDYRGGYLGTPAGRAYFYQAGTLNYTDYSVQRIQEVQRRVGRIRN